MVQRPLDRLLRLTCKYGVVRSRDLASHNIARQYLKIAKDQDLLSCVSRGIYVATAADVTEHHDLVEVCKRVPSGVICLLSALRFHELTTQLLFEIWLAVGQKARTPKMDYSPLRVVRFSPATLQFGVKVYQVEGIRVPVSNPAKTVADCFKFRN